MENQLPTQEKLSNSYHENKQKFIHTVKDNLNYIYIVLMIMANCIISLLKIEDGAIGLRYPKDGLGWALWFTQIAITTFIGVMILNAFRRQGIKNGHTAIKTTYDAYVEAITQPSQKEQHPRSLKQYLRIQNTRDSLVKSLIYVILNMFVASVAISANINGLLSLVTTTIFAVGFGLKAMLDAEEYVITELVIWYKQKTQEANLQEKPKNIKKETVKNARQVKRNTKPRLRPTESSRVQQGKEHTTGQETSDANKSS